MNVPASLALLALWLAAGALARQLAADPAAAAGSSRVGRQERSILWQFLGASRKAFSEHLLLEAERYFHRGVTHSGGKVFEGVFAGWAEAVSPTDHIETEGTELHEILPLLQFSVQLDPEHVESYLTAAYWIARNGDLERADAVLRDAELFNPGDYRVQLARGRLFLKTGKKESAAMALESALRSWPGEQKPDDLQSRLDRAQILCFRAALHEANRERESALRLYRQALALFPDRSLLGRRVEEIESGRDTSAWASETLDALFVNPHASHLQAMGLADEHADHREAH